MCIFRLGIFSFFPYPSLQFLSIALNSLVDRGSGDSHRDSSGIPVFFLFDVPVNIFHQQELSQFLVPLNGIIAHIH